MLFLNGIFLPYYPILKSVPHKAGDITAMLGSLLVLFITPFINTSKIKSTTCRLLFKIFFWLFIVDFVVLMWAGQKPVRDAYTQTEAIATAYYFLFFLLPYLS